MWPPTPSVAGSPARAPPAAWSVDKATSNLLIGPDWATNLEICDTLNTDVWQSKDTIKAVKKRIQNKDPKVQFFALTLLETLMKNCGEYVHVEVVEQNIPQEMVKIVQKKCDLQVRDKILVLLDCWQEAFGGPGGRFPQYYFAYVELKRMGIVFPRRPIDAPIFTPPVTYPASSSRLSLTHGPSGSAPGTLNERMASENGTLSLSDLKNFRTVLELLSDMVQALKPTDQAAARDEVIMDLVNQCRANQTKVMQLVSSTGNEEILKQGLELNDSLQSVLARHHAIATGAPLPLEQAQPTTSAHHPATATATTPLDSALVAEQPQETSMREVNSSTASAVGSINISNEEEENDEFAQLARRKHKPSDLALVPVGYASEASSSVSSSALVPVEPPAISRGEQNLIDLMSLSIVPVNPDPSSSSEVPADQNGTQDQSEPSMSASSNAQYPQPSLQAQPYPQNQGYAPQNSYVAPWAQPAQAQSQQYPSTYTTLPWATPNPYANAATYRAPPTAYPKQNPATAAATPSPIPQPMQRLNSFTNGPKLASQPVQQMGSFGSQPSSGSAKAEVFGGSRPYYMPDNLFGDLVDVKSYSGGSKTTRPTSSSGASDKMADGSKK